MDPITKWILTIIGMFITLIIVMALGAGAGKYSIYVTDSPYEGYSMVYVVNTKSGEVKAKLHRIEDHISKNGKVKDYAEDVIEEINPNQFRYKYDYDSTPNRKKY